MRGKIDSYLGFAKKSRRLLTGYHACLDGLQRGKIRALVLTSDLAPGTREKLIRAAGLMNIEWCVYGTMESLSEVTGETNRGVFGVTDGHLAAAVLQEAQKSGQ